MKQTGFFDAQIEADRAAEQERDRIRNAWNPERAKDFEPGHPLADPAAYPSAEEVLAMPKKENSLHDWPTADTPKAKEKRARMFHAALVQLDKDLERYRNYKAGEFEVSVYEMKWSFHGDRMNAWANGMCYAYNHLRYAHAQVETARARFPELAGVKLK